MSIIRVPSKNLLTTGREEHGGREAGALQEQVWDTEWWLPASLWGHDKEF